MNSCFYGYLVNWYEGVFWYYGIGFDENLIFDIGGFLIFMRNLSEFFIVLDV